MGEAQVATAGSLLHRCVKNAEGEQLGRIEELMIDLERGFIAYAVVGMAEAYSEGRKFFVVPWGAFTIDPVDRAFVLDVQRATLENAPGADEQEPGLAPCGSGAEDRWMRNGACD